MFGLGAVQAVEVVAANALQLPPLLIPQGIVTAVSPKQLIAIENLAGGVVGAQPVGPAGRGHTHKIQHVALAQVQGVPRAHRAKPVGAIAQCNFEGVGPCPRADNLGLGCQV